MPTSFENKKELRFVITLGTGNFGSSGANQITIEGFRATADIDNGGGQMFAHLRANIFGVSQSDMNTITTLQYQALTTSPNTVYVFAVDGDQVTQVFQGNLINAWGNYQQMPDVFLQLEARAGYINSLQPVPPRSFQGAADVAGIMSQLASSMGYTFENNGVTTQLSNPYLPGTALDQAKALATAAGIWWGIDGQTLWIAPPNGSRATQSVPQIGVNSDLKGYPTFDGQGYVIFECLFNPAIKFLGHVNLVTSIPRAAGQWTVVGIRHKLESEKDGGAWFSTVRVTSSGLVPVN